MFSFCCFTILVMAAIDSFLLLYYGQHINELNPIGKWLIDTRGVMFFFCAKVIGTFLSLLFLVVLFRIREDMAVAVASVLALFMTCVVVFQIT